MDFIKRYKFLFRFLGKLLGIALFFTLLLTFIVTPHRMTGTSMFPAVRDGDLGLFYKPGDAYLKDVVLYEAEGRLHVGRVIAYEGQTVDFLEGGSYTVDGYTPFEDVPYETAGTEDGEYPVTVPEGSVFVLNDYRPDVTDSRTYGVISQDRIEGKLLFLLRRRNF